MVGIGSGSNVGSPRVRSGSNTRSGSKTGSGSNIGSDSNVKSGCPDSGCLSDRNYSGDSVETQPKVDPRKKAIEDAANAIRDPNNWQQVTPQKPIKLEDEYNTH